MKDITIRQLQEELLKIDHSNNAIDKYFYKLSEEVGELAKAIRKNSRMENDNIKETIEEELNDVLYYVICLANIYNIDLQKCILLKEEINAVKYNRKKIFVD